MSSDRTRPRQLSRRQFLSGAAAAGGIAAGGSTLASILAACGASSSHPASSTSAAITMAVYQEPDTLDPGATGLITVGMIDLCIFDPLIWRLSINGTTRFYPGLASSWQVSPDATTYTFKLRSDVKFHDGTPLDASAVKATFDHIANPATKSRSAAGDLGPYQETRVLDPHTAQIVFKQPNASFLDEVASIDFGISSPTALARYGSDYAHHPVGTGPFRFKEYVVGQHVTVERNPEYRWGPAPIRSGPPLLSQVTFRILSDPGARFDALQTGEIQIAPNLNPQDIAKLRGNPQYSLYKISSTGMPWVIMVNAQKPPTDDLNVRRALEYATDKEAIIKTLYFGLHTAADQTFTPTTPGYNPAIKNMYPHDPQKAGQLLDAAGWTMGSGGIRTKNGQPLQLNFINIAGYGFDGISELMQSQFRQVGIQVSISDQSFPAVADTYNSGAQHLADFFYYDVSPYFVRSIYGCDQIAHGFNWEHYCNPELDSLVDQANATVDSSKRDAMYQEASKIIQQAAVIIPIYNSDGLFVASSHLKGLHFTVNAFPLLHGASY